MRANTGQVATLIGLLTTVAAVGNAATNDGGSALPADAAADPWANEAGAQSSACPVFRAELRSAEDFKAANPQHPRMAEIDQKIAMTRKALAACLDQARDIAAHGTPAQRYAERVQREQHEQEEQDAAEQREVDARSKDPAFTRARLSALLCYVASARKRAKEIIDDERKGARAGLGFVDKQKVYEQQGEFVIASKVERTVKADLKVRKVAPLPCKPGPSKEFADCIDSARSAPATDHPGENEYSAEANRIADFSTTCIPWKRLTPEAPAPASTTSTPR